MNPTGELTTTRPLSNDDRKEIWKDRRNTSPLDQEQPSQFRFCVSVLKELAGWALLAVTGLAFLYVLKWAMEGV